MKNFIKVTRTEDSNGGQIWISKYQIIFMEADVSHSQTFIQLPNYEINVTENISDILAQLGE
jgi:hypothetical protein